MSNEQGEVLSFPNYALAMDDEAFLESQTMMLKLDLMQFVTNWMHQARVFKPEGNELSGKTSPRTGMPLEVISRPEDIMVLARFEIAAKRAIRDMVITLANNDN